MASGHTRPAFTGAPHRYHRAARRMGAGWPIPQVARVLKCDPMDLHLLLREAPFAELFRAYCDLRELSPEERLRRLKEVALLVLEEALEEKDPPPPIRCDDAVLENDLAFIREHGQSRRSLPPDFLELIEAEHTRLSFVTLRAGGGSGGGAVGASSHIPRAPTLRRREG
jgi:hypothetical protein